LAPEFGILILAHPVCKMRIIQNQKRQHYEINAILKRKIEECAACLKNSVRIFVEKIHEIGCLEGSDMPVLYTGRRFLKVKARLCNHCCNGKTIFITYSETVFVA
jgi:hypothetical protein